MKNIAIGVDVGGSHVSCMAYDLIEKKLLTETLSEADLNNHGKSDEVIAAWGGVIKKTIELVGLENVGGIGFAMPGPFDYVKGIPLFKGENGKYENIYGIDVPVLLRSFLGIKDDLPIRFINDATAFAIGEDQVGKAKDYNQSLSVTLGTGFGSAFIKGGLPIVEGDEVPQSGCLWHLPFEDGIADDYFSTRGLLKRYEQATGQKLSGVKQIADLVSSSQEAQALFNDFGEKMGQFLAPWIKTFNLEVFIMGGNISRAYKLFGDALSAYLKQEDLQLKVAVSELKETASFIGAATLIDDAIYQSILAALRKM
ncbi:ROK family protein [Carboxylicivirga sp. N1Y90]|uniref:ROK family protein n=1 Tax=Carboxylicivirga fragile TaxID=3417571 RepID=UPI003D32A8E6|nr:ROK family protein [Marinilabiliaceae bacterium N1Y90]